MPTILRNLRIDRVASVDKGAGEGVQILLMKRHGVPAEAAKRDVKAQAAGIAADAGSSGEQGGDEMSAALKKALGLAESATEDDIVKAIAKKDADAAAALAKVSKENLILKMSAKHKDFMDKSDMSDDMKDKFSAMSADERDAHCAKNPVEKRLPEEVQKALAEAVDLKKRLAVLEDDKQRADFAKRAIEAGLPETEGETLRKAYQGDAAAIAKMETVLKGLTEQVRTGKVFAEFGKSGGNSAPTAEGEMQHAAEEYRKGQIALGNSCSEQQAFTKIYTDPAKADLKKRYLDERDQKKRAA